MPLPLSIADLWKIFEWANDHKAKNKAAVVEWLESVYNDLEDLCKVWFKICETMDEAEVQGTEAEARRIITRGSSGWEQAAYAGRLMSFYHNASRVLTDKKAAQFHAQFIDGLGRVLYNRRVARDLLERYGETDGGPAPTSLQRMQELASAIQQQAVELQVLIKTFKAQP